MIGSSRLAMSPHGRYPFFRKFPKSLNIKICYSIVASNCSFDWVGRSCSRSFCRWEIKCDSKFLGLGFSPIPLSVESIPQHWKLWVGFQQLPVWGVKHFKGLFVILRHESCPDGERSFFQLFSLILERLKSKASSWVLPQKVKVNRESQNWGNLKFVYFFISFNEGLENQAKIVW